MTGYGRFEGVVDNKKILIEIKSVNHRFADYNIKVPRYLGYLEEKIRSFVSEYISRGKVDIFVSIEYYGEADKQVTLNKELASNYYDVLRQMSSEFKLSGDISVSLLSRFSDIFLTERKEEDAEQMWNTVKQCLSEAVSAFVAMREREGRRIVCDLKEKEKVMRASVLQIEERSPKCLSEYRQRLTDKISEVLQSTDIDEARILTEAAIYADKIAVDEETVRLRSHFEELDGILESSEPIGRRLDFLVQEINREINTIGSKCNDITISKLVIGLKNDLEKVREQIQNLE